jgi:hypothetical protein
MVIEQPRVSAVVVDGVSKVQRFVPIEHRCSAVLHRDIALRSPASATGAERLPQRIATSSCWACPAWTSELGVWLQPRLRRSPA